MRLLAAAPALLYGAALLVLLLPPCLHAARTWRRHPAPTKEQTRHVEQQQLTARQELDAACCVCSWVSHGTRHDTHCTTETRA
ncbi:hypothetical protein AB0903_33555 [Streptomyces sp. NPDC048389]|uniref:hypothetical protein n=1 Tax=Streptomyces sp. NPDC048389 TaxID=3154622 RepID=UPI003453A7D1